MLNQLTVDLRSIDFNKFEISRVLSIGNVFWTTQDNQRVSISRMSDNHLINTIKHIDQRVTMILEYGLTIPGWADVFENLVIEAYRRNLIDENNFPKLTSYKIRFPVKRPV